MVIPEGSDGNGWLDVSVQLQKLTNYHAKQHAGMTVVGRKTVTAPRVLGLRREGQSYATVLGEQLPKGGGVPAEGRGSKVIRTESEKEESLIVAGDHPKGSGVTFSNQPIGSIMGNGLKQNLDEAFLRQFKEEAERWLGLLELGCGNEKRGSSGLEDGGQGNKAHSELIMWDRRVVEKVEEYVGRYTLALSLRNVEDNFSWAFGGVYGPNDDGERRVW
jgi:hypothetical protein